MGGGNFYVSYAIPSGAYSSYTHDCVDNADSPYQTIADVIDIFKWDWHWNRGLWAHTKTKVEKW